MISLWQSVLSCMHGTGDPGQEKENAFSRNHEEINTSHNTCVNMETRKERDCVIHILLYIQRITNVRATRSEHGGMV